jgi:predicted O-methyltransferase YrrM
VTDGGSSIPEVRRLLTTLVAAKPGGRIAEAGTAFGEGAKAVVAALTGDASFVTVEPDPDRYEAAREALGGTPAEVLHGRWEELLPSRGPFDLLFLDAGTRGETLELAISLLAPAGILLKDDLTPGAPVAGDPVREALLLDERLLAVEVMTTPTAAAIVAVKR